MLDSVLSKAFPTHDLHVIKSFTVLGVDGKIHRSGTIPGLIIVDMENHRPVMIVDEVSDESTINFYVHKASNAAFFQSEISSDCQEIVLNR